MKAKFKGLKKIKKKTQYLVLQIIEYLKLKRFIYPDLEYRVLKHFLQYVNGIDMPLYRSAGPLWSDIGQVSRSLSAPIEFTERLQETL